MVRTAASQGTRGARPRAEAGTTDGAKQNQQTSQLDGLISTKDVLVVCGPGGVGKTTTAASCALMAAMEHEARVLVLTVDPAKRLADALGIGQLGNQEMQVDLNQLSTGGRRARGELWAAMLDTKQSWDALVRRHAPDAKTAEQILGNPLYASITGRFVQSHDYIAMERLYEIHTEGNYDLIVVDTPPTRNALDFLEAPARMEEFFSSRLLKWILMPYRSKLVTLASRPFQQVADRILGSQFLGDISSFFSLFQTMYDGFVERARLVQKLLKDEETTFMVVSTLELVPLREAESFMDALAERKLNLGAVVLNKVLPEYLRDKEALELAERLRADAASIASKLSTALGPDLGEERVLASVLEEVGTSFVNFQHVARREAEQERTMTTRAGAVVTVPYFDTDIYDLEGLIRLGDKLWEDG